MTSKYKFILSLIIATIGLIISIFLTIPCISPFKNVELIIQFYIGMLIAMFASAFTGYFICEFDRENFEKNKKI